MLRKFPGDSAMPHPNLRVQVHFHGQGEDFPLSLHLGWQLRDGVFERDSSQRSFQ